MSYSYICIKVYLPHSREANVQVGQRGGISPWFFSLVMLYFHKWTRSFFKKTRNKWDRWHVLAKEVSCILVVGERCKRSTSSYFEKRCYVLWPYIWKMPSRCVYSDDGMGQRRRLHRPSVECWRQGKQGEQWISKSTRLLARWVWKPWRVAVQLR